MPLESIDFYNSYIKEELKDMNVTIVFFRTK